MEKIVLDNIYKINETIFKKDTVISFLNEGETHKEAEALTKSIRLGKKIIEKGTLFIIDKD